MKGQKGFLLLEVIVSIVVLVSGLVFVSLSFSASKKLIQKSDTLFTSALALREKLYDAEQPGAGSASGAFDDHPGLEWRMSVRSDADSNLRRIDVSVFPDDKPTASESATTLLPALEKS